MSEGKQSAESVLKRRLRILELLPTAANGAAGLTTEELTAALDGSGIACNLRTVQRDLAAMEDVNSMWYALGVKVKCSKGSLDRGGRWRHESGGKLQFLHSLSSEQALMLSLVEQELQQFLPPAAYRDISAQLAKAQQVLELPNYDNYARYRERVRVLPEGPPRVTPEPVMSMLGKINEVLLNGVQLDLQYVPREANDERHYRLHPVGLVQQGLFHWLLGIKHEHMEHANLLDKVGCYRCDRIRGITPRQYDVVGRNLPTLDAALQAGCLEFFSEGEPLTLVLRFAATDAGASLCTSFREAPLGEGQVITANNEGGHDLRTTVRQSLQLQWLLQRYADRIKVLEPVTLSDHLRQFAWAAAALQQ
jgi:predicted DNA-binding transcriptional regulator YafY